MRTDGSADRVAVASAIASGSPRPDCASANQLANCVKGLGSRSRSERPPDSAIETVRQKVDGYAAWLEAKGLFHDIRLGVDMEVDELVRRRRERRLWLDVRAAA